MPAASRTFFQSVRSIISTSRRRPLRSRSVPYKKVPSGRQGPSPGPRARLQRRGSHSEDRAGVLLDLHEDRRERRHPERDVRDEVRLAEIAIRPERDEPREREPEETRGEVPVAEEPPREDRVPEGRAEDRG